MELDFFKILTSALTMQAVIFSIYFIFFYQQNKSIFILGLFLFFYVGSSIMWMINLNFPDFSSRHVYLPLNFAFALLPTFYLYVKSVFGKIKKSDMWHLVPGAVEFCIYIFFLFFQEIGDQFYNEDNTWPIIILTVIIPFIYNCWYLCMAMKLIQKKRKLISYFYNDYEKQKINWIRITIFIFLVENILDVISFLLKLSTTADKIFFIADFLITGFLIYYISISGLNQKKLILDSSIVETSKVFDKKKTEERIVIHNETDKANDDEQKKYEAILLFVRETKVFTNPDLNLYALSTNLQMQHREVSRLINYYSKLNFNQFINKLRIEEAKEIISDPESKKYNLEYVSEKAGFKSRSLLFTNFKKFTGETPTEYRNKLS